MATQPGSSVLLSMTITEGCYFEQTFMEANVEDLLVKWTFLRSRIRAFNNRGMLFLSAPNSCRHGALVLTAKQYLREETYTSTISCIGLSVASVQCSQEHC